MLSKNKLFLIKIKIFLFPEENARLPLPVYERVESAGEHGGAPHQKPGISRHH